jgi:deoxyguanosine kinase
VEMQEKRLPGHITFLCIEGVIGAGKTTLCEMISQQYKMRPLYESPEENPFLTDFYRNRNAYAFQTQLWFLLSRQRQLTTTALQEELFSHGTVADYLFAKDRIFATLTLDENEMTLYSSIAKILENSMPQPDFVIYLQASTDVLIKRIAKRGRRYEHGIDRDYIDALNEAYNHYFFHYTDSPLLIVNANEVDFVSNPADFSDIIRQVVEIRGGTKYYHAAHNAATPRSDSQGHSLL